MSVWILHLFMSSGVGIYIDSLAEIWETHAIHIHIHMHKAMSCLASCSAITFSILTCMYTLIVDTPQPI